MLDEITAPQNLSVLAARNAQRVFLVDGQSGRQISYAEFHKTASRIAAYFQGQGLRKGDCIALLLNNCVELAEIYFACLQGGFVAVPINPTLSAEEISYIASSVQPKVFIASSVSLKSLASLSDSLPVSLRLLVGPHGAADAANSTGDFAKWDIHVLDDASNFEPFAGSSLNDVAVIMFTSGTTARPRGVMHAIGNLIGNAKGFIQELGIGPASRFCSSFPMTYMAGYYNLLLVPYIAEASLVVMEAFNARSAIRFWDPLIAHGVNTLWLPPTAVAILLEIDRSPNGPDYCRKNIVLAMTATAPLPNQVRLAFEKKYGVALYQSYGLSELLFICSNKPSKPIVNYSVGYALPGIEVTIRDEDGRLLQWGEEGEVNIASPHVMLGYFDPNADKPAMPAAPFPTGDVGVIGAAGELTITGRKKDLIIRGGLNISPAGIEEVLHRHPAVLECAVVGIPHHLHGEEPAAAVRIAGTEDFGRVQADLIELCRIHLGAPKRPAHVIELKEFPHSSSGKIQKYQVRSILMGRLGVETAKVERPSKAPMIPGRVRRTFERLSPDIVASLGRYPTGIISDCMNRLGMLDSRIRPIVGQRPLCGSAVTVEEVEAGNMMSHAALEMLRPGDVLVIDAKGTTTRSAFGGLQLLSAQRNGCAGVVIYGTVRDTGEIVKSGLPVYSLGTSPGGPMKGWGGNINYPIACAGVVVNPGDVIIGDDDGVVVVPKELAEELPALCEQRLGIEEEWFARINNGESTLDAVNLRIQLDRLGIRYD